MRAKQIKIADIMPPEVTVRTLYDEAKFDELLVSIRDQGLIQPIVVVKEGDKYRLVAGRRRLEVCKVLKWKKIPSVIQDYTEEQVAIIRLHENVNREDVNPIDLANYIRSCMDRFNWSQSEAADHLNRSDAYVSQYLKLLTLDEETKRMVAIGELGARAGYHLAKIEDQKTRKVWAGHIKKFGMPVKELEKSVAQYQEEEYAKAHPEARPPPDYTTQPYDRPQPGCFMCGAGYEKAILHSKLVCDLCLDALRRAAAQQQGGE